jgi:pectinesterase
LLADAFGNGFLAQDLTIRNAAGPKGNQAVALRSNSNHSVVYRCRIEGYQDTLWAENERQLYLESNISGTVDLVFGNAKAFFQKCRIQVRRPLDQGGQRKHNVITAQGRNNPNATDSGFVFHECYVEAAPGDDLNGVDTFLGRPYKQYSHVAFVNSYLSGVVNALGWVHWDRSQEVNKTTVTVGYYEFGNQGPGADTSRRVHWDGLHIDLTTAAAASTFTADAFIGASHWVPKQIHYEHGLGAAPPPPLVHAGRAA